MDLHLIYLLCRLHNNTSPYFLFFFFLFCLNLLLSHYRCCLSLNLIFLNKRTCHHFLFWVFLKILERLWLLCVVFHYFYKLVVFEFTLLNSAIGKSDFTKAMLHSLFPVTLINTSIYPIHLSITMPFVVAVFSNVIISTLPIKLSMSMFLVVLIVTRILIAIRIFLVFLPLAFSVFHALFELTDKRSP